MSYHILHVITGLRTGGAETMLLKLLNHLSSSAFRSTVISLTNGQGIEHRLRANGVNVHAIGLQKSLFSPVRLWRTVRLIRSLKPDLIQGWMIHGNLVAQCAALIATRVPVIWNVRHSTSQSHVHTRTTRALIRLSSSFSGLPVRILYNSRNSAREHESIGYCAEKTLVIPNGFDCSLFCPDPSARESVRAELGLTTDTQLIGLCARYHAMKDHGAFFQAASRIALAFPQVHFLLVGPGIDRSNRRLLSLSEPWLLSNRVHLLGERLDIPRINAALDIAVSSSVAGEGFSNAIGEAMACGVPCVVTDVGDSAFLVSCAGIAVPPADPCALAEACIQLLRSPVEVRRRLGLEGRARIVSHFSIERVTDLYQRLYEGILGQSVEIPIKVTE